MIGSRVRPPAFARLIPAAALALVLAACTDYRQIRAVSVDASGDERSVICEVPASGDYPEKCATHSIEHRSYSDGKGHVYDYYLAYVEFDDQGWFWDRKQMEALLRLLYEPDPATGKSKDYLIFAHAHGWQHNANRCDNNVVCFSRVLERFDLMERRFKAEEEGAKPRPVVGVYIGWRGRSLDIGGIDNLSFWERKNTALRVGTGGVFELLVRLNDFRRFTNKTRERDRTQLFISGHSFGGEVIYTALAHALMERAAATHGKPKDEDKIEYDTANSFGDLVVLENPAFEGSMYEPLHHIATNRCYPASQRPSLLIVTSEADAATGTAFPLGRSVSNLFETTQSVKSKSDQRDTIIKTVGHLERYRTHQLELRPGVKPRAPTGSDAPCDCPYLGPVSGFDVDAEIEFHKRDALEARQGKRGKGADGPFTTMSKFGEAEIGYGDRLVLKRNTDYSPNFPLMIISTTGDIIPDHNAIYGPDFTDFLRRFYIRHINSHLNFPAQCFGEVPACRTSDITPCEESCRRADGSSCSSRVGVTEIAKP